MVISDNQLYSKKLDTDNNVKGIIGISVDVNNQENMEILEKETELKSIKLEKQEEVKTLVEQVVHDIHSPLLALSIFVRSCESLSEKDQAFLESAIDSIENITRNLINKYEENLTEEPINLKEDILVPFSLSDVIQTKKYQIRKPNIFFNFSKNVTEDFIFIKGNNINFRRMISALINNAVESFDISGGTVDIGLNLENREIKIYVQSDGDPIPKEIINAVLRDIPHDNARENKRYAYVWKTKEITQQMNGKMLIESSEGFGIRITLTFLQSESPEWVTKEVIIPKSSIVIILDDDRSTYKLLKNRLDEYFSDISIKYFEFGNDVINFIKSSKEKEKIFLLADYDLRNQDLSGIDVIEECKFYEQSILISSCHMHKIKNFPTKSNVIKFLSKNNIPDIPFKII